MTGADPGDEPAAADGAAPEPDLPEADGPRGRPLTHAARVLAGAALAVALVGTLVGLVALTSSSRTVPSSRDASHIPAIAGAGPLDAGMAMVQGQLAPVGHPVVFQLALSNLATRPLTVLAVRPLLLGSGLRLTRVRGLDPHVAGRTQPLAGYQIPPEGPIPSSLLAGLEITLTRTTPGASSLVGIAISYRVGARTATGTVVVRDDQVLDSWGVCTTPTAGGGCAPTSLDALLGTTFPSGPAPVP